MTILEKTIGTYSKGDRKELTVEKEKDAIRVYFLYNGKLLSLHAWRKGRKFNVILHGEDSYILPVRFPEYFYETETPSHLLPELSITESDLMRLVHRMEEWF